jgi:hypothetical protein
MISRNTTASGKLAGVKARRVTKRAGSGHRHGWINSLAVQDPPGFGGDLLHRNPTAEVLEYGCVSLNFRLHLVNIVSESGMHDT